MYYPISLISQLLTEVDFFFFPHLVKFLHSEKQKYYPIDSVIVLQSLIAVLRSPLKRFWGEDGLSLGGINEERSLCSRRLKLQPKHSSGSSKWRRAVWTRWAMLRKMGPNSVWRDTPPLFGSPCPVLHTEDNHYPPQQSLHPSLHPSINQLPSKALDGCHLLVIQSHSNSKACQHIVHVGTSTLERNLLNDECVPSLGTECLF